MNQFRDVSRNNTSRFSSSFKRNDTNNRFKSSSRFSSSNNAQHRPPLPTNNRWKRDETESPQFQSNSQNRFKSRRSTLVPNYRRGAPSTSHLEPHEINPKFVDVKSMGVAFEHITSKPKQNKNKKKNKKKKKQEALYVQEKSSSHIKKYSKKYDLTNHEDDVLNASIVNQYNYEVIEESDEQEEEPQPEHQEEDQ